jgi:hypothetical protein
LRVARWISGAQFDICPVFRAVGDSSCEPMVFPCCCSKADRERKFYDSLVPDTTQICGWGPATAIPVSGAVAPARPQTAENCYPMRPRGELLRCSSARAGGWKKHG